MRPVFIEWATLMGRNIRVFLADRFALSVALMQVPIITLLVRLAFAGFADDHADADYFARSIHYFRAEKAPYEAQHTTVPLNEVIAKARQEAKAESNLISLLAAHRRAAVYFVLVSAAIWLGLMGACKDLVAEQHVLRRETRSCIRIIPCLLAKFMLHVLVLAPQTVWMAAWIGFGLLALPLQSVLYLWGVLWLTACAAAALGLAISGISTNIRLALTLVPLLMIPQLMLGGLLRPPAEPGKDPLARRICEQLTLQRWGFEAAIIADPHAEQGVVAVEFGSWEEAARYSELNLIRSRTFGLMELLFHHHAGQVRDTGVLFRYPLAVLVLMIICLLTFTGFVVYFRLQRLRRGVSQWRFLGQLRLAGKRN